jgi:microcystin-dependent protein
LTAEIYRYRECRQVIKMDIVDEEDYTTMVSVCMPLFAWKVARAYLSVQAKRYSSYAFDFSPFAYLGPTEAQFNTIEEAIDIALAADINECEVGEMPIIGEIRTFAITGLLPDGWLECNGAAYPKLSFPDLYAVIGDTFGAGEYTFNVPNLARRVVVGVGGDWDLGDNGGEEQHTLSVDEMPSHRHQQSWEAGTSGGYQHTAFDSTSSGQTASNDYTQYEGYDQPHNNLQPYLALRYAIYWGEI